VLVAVLARLCNWPHFAATSYRLYHARENVGQYPLTALLVPVILVAATIGAFAHPTTMGTMFVKLAILWSPYHFSGQTLGISLLYARRAGIAIGRATRRLLTAFVFSAFAWAMARAESGAGVRHYLGVDHPKLGVPPWMVYGCAVVLCLSGAALLVVVARWCVRERRMLPPVVALPAVAQLIWLVVGRDYESFQVLVPFFHSLQYLLIAWALQISERVGSGGVRRTGLALAAESARWWGINVVLGLVLFAVAPWACTFLGYDLLFAMAVTSAAVQLHHFFVDGVIWKLENPRVRSPLLTHVPALLRPPATALPEAA
jgi:hypothetical protein